MERTPGLAVGEPGTPAIRSDSAPPVPLSSAVALAARRRNAVKTRTALAVKTTTRPVVKAHAQRKREEARRGALSSWRGALSGWLDVCSLSFEASAVGGGLEGVLAGAGTAQKSLVGGAPLVWTLRGSMI